MSEKLIEEAKFFPTKNFFVEMLTRDIELKDAILDLLDNCIDGATRSGANDYKGFRADIHISNNSFKITDNCGGIPYDQIEYAFRLGRPIDTRTEELATVGIYGIGMKRAIFKMGRNATINSQFSDSESFTVNINQKWLTDDRSWSIPIKYDLALRKVNGTEIEIKGLRKTVKKLFSDTSFKIDLINAIKYSYSYIISKGFLVYVNGKKVLQDKLEFKFDNVSKEKAKIVPYVYLGEEDGVQVDLIVGFYRAPLNETELESELEFSKKSSKDAGWTVMCNDRVVLSNDKTEMTGWGVSAVPKFHSQFIPIAGIVHFRSNDPSKLPLTTTKRGVDGNSSVYLKIKDKMVEGMKIFISYTNKWKHEHIDEGKSIVKSVKNTITVDQLRSDKTLAFKSSSKKGVQVQKPILPTPKVHTDFKWVRYKRKKDEIEFLSDYLYGESNISANEIGNECFERILKEAEK